MRKPSYSVAHERENQRRRELLEKEEEERNRMDFFKNYKNQQYDTPLDPIPAEPKPQLGTKEDLMMKMMRLMVDGPPPTIRVIARFGQSNYDITITKVEELEAVQAIINKFINAHQNPNNF